MNWTLAKLTVPAWYWYRKDEDGIQVLMSVRSSSEASMWAVWPSGRVDRVTDLPGEWSGPQELR
jgi:hypothetical protein